MTSSNPQSFVSRESVLSALGWRYATKAFDSQKKIDPKDWAVLEQSLVLAPSSYGLQPWKFIVVQNPSLRSQLREVSWNQSQVTDCSHYVVLATMKAVDEAHVRRFVERIASVRGVPAAALDGYRDMMVGDVVKGPRSQMVTPWAQRQAYIAMGFLLETAGLLGVDACPLEGLDPQAYDEILGLKGSNWGSVAAVALGYRSDKDEYSKAKKVRFEAKDLVEYK